ncbi:hypothetical protein HYPSUDRAFT_204972 [Hypholoma sublateritium FD-334 SS-4]|uniref:Uncharacterized protein n=1 Tax=Hypholoma sublateritium (strain FD-334 SS-4) TaxID=945553 RepID=A0A0D2NQ26_HYPSF|nr:hypothetical protein HYPSUDRAFT_204972 [Hypholoma sublateritium FD-334 SS-4]
MTQDRRRSACTSIVACAGAIIRCRAASTLNNAATVLARALQASFAAGSLSNHPPPSQVAAVSFGARAGASPPISTPPPSKNAARRHCCLRGRRLSPPPPLPHSKQAIAAPVGASTLAWVPFSATPPFRNQIQSPPLDAHTAASLPNNAAMAGSLSERPPPNQGTFASFDARAGTVPFSATPPTPKNDGTARVQPPRVPSLASPLSGIPKRCHGACGSFDALVGVHLCHPGHPQPETTAVTPA